MPLGGFCGNSRETMNDRVESSLARLSREVENVLDMGTPPPGRVGRIQPEYCDTHDYMRSSSYRRYYEVSPAPTPKYSPVGGAAHSYFPDVEHIAASGAKSGAEYNLCQSGSVCCGGGCGGSKAKAPLAAAAPHAAEYSSNLVVNAARVPPPSQYVSPTYYSPTKPGTPYPLVGDIYPGSKYSLSSCICGKPSGCDGCSKYSNACRVADVEAHLSQQRRNLMRMSAKMDELERLTRDTMSLATSTSMRSY